MVMCSPHSTHLEFIFSQEELWEEIHSSLLDSWFQLKKKHFSWNERTANVNIVIILMNMTQLTLELDFMCPIVFFEAGFSWCQPIRHILFSQAGELFWNLAGLPNGAPSSQGPAQQRGGSPYMLPREYILGPLCNSAGSTGTFRPRRTHCGTWSAGGGCPLSLGNRQEENTAWANVGPREETHSVSAVFTEQWKPYFASNQGKSKCFPKDISLSLQS